MKGKLALIALFFLVSSCGVSKLNKVQEPKITPSPPKYEVGTITVGGKIEELKKIKIHSADFEGVPLSTVLSAVMTDGKTNFTTNTGTGTTIKQDLITTTRT